jgi:hypothetical protein
MNFQDVKLVSPDDPENRLWQREFGNLWREKKATKVTSDSPSPNFHPSLDRLSKIMERTVIRWLAGHFPLLSTNILAYQFRNEGRTFRNEGRTHFRELDAVSGLDGTPEWIFEVKTIRNNSASRRNQAREQLYQIYKIASDKWPSVRICNVVVDIRSFNFREWKNELAEIHLASVMNNNVSQGDIPTLFVSAADLWHLAFDYGFIHKDDCFVQEISNEIQSTTVQAPFRNDRPGFKVAPGILLQPGTDLLKLRRQRHRSKRKLIPAQPAQIEKRPDHCAFVANISYRTTKGFLTTLFERCGKIDHLDLPIDIATDRLRGICFVWFDSADSVPKAIRELNGYKIDGRPISVRANNYSVEE